MPAFGVSDAELQAALAELQDLPEEELDAFFEDGTQELSDGHLVEYAEECVDHTEKVDKKRILLDEQLWNAHESEMAEMSQKEDWQAKITTNEPFQTVTQAKMLVRKAVVDKPEWFDVSTQLTDDPASKMKADFWQDSLRWWLKRAKFHQLFPDMNEMSFAIGISMAMKALWTTDQDGIEGLKLMLIEPWKIRRDIDAQSRDPQSGLYCVHQDWVDYHTLLEGEKNGFYQNVRDCLHDRAEEGTWNRGKERRKRGLVDHSNRFRPQIFVREFWGGVLDHNGEMVYPKVRYTIANRTVISRPQPVKFPRIKWPIHQFSALPHLRNFHGYSLIEGMLKMWKFRNNILSMCADKLSFVLNGGYELDDSKLINPADKELFPGCVKNLKGGQRGAYSLIPTDKDFLPVVDGLMNLTGNLFQNGVFVTELLKGENGTRNDITLGEVEIKTQQAMGVFEGIGHDVEYGGEQAIEMVQDVLTTYWDPNDNPGYMQVLGQKHAAIIGMISMMSPEQRIEAVKMETDIEIQGVSILFKKSALIDRLVNLVKLTDSPRFIQYAKDDVMIRKVADAMDVSEAIKTEEEMMIQMQQQQMAMLAQAQGMQPGAMPGADPMQAAPQGSMPIQEPGAGQPQPEAGYQ